MVCRLFNGKLVSSTLLDRVRHVSFLIRSRICFIFSRIITKKTKLSPSPIKNKHTNNFFRVDIIHTCVYYILYLGWDIKIFIFFEKLFKSQLGLCLFLECATRCEMPSSFRFLSKNVMPRRFSESSFSLNQNIDLPFLLKVLSYWKYFFDP